MASIPTQPSLPSGDSRPNKQKPIIDIPYNRWENRLKRAARSFVKITILLSILSFLYIFANSSPVAEGMVFSGIGLSFQLALQIFSILIGIVAQFGLIFWFLSRPKVDIIKPGDDQTVTFDDYWGQPELVKLVKQWMSLLRDRKEFEKMGGKYISGLLLYGPPGTGKTMLAKAVAGESGMAFISALGTSFQGMFWGMDILMILRFTKWARDLAKKYGACVAYIDEIDAIGMSRGGVQTGGRSVGIGMGMGYGSFGLTTLLSQMDGVNAPSRMDKFKTRLWRRFGLKYVPKRNWHIMWMGSTNRPDVLDPALTRSGRLDTKIQVAAPDRASRRLIVQGYLKKIKFDDSVDVEAIVADTNGMTPADISGAITKDAVRIAFFDGRKLVSQKDIDKAFMEQSSGMEMPIEEIDEDQERATAYHEAGHAVAQYYMMPDQKIVRTTIVRLSNGSLGHMAPASTKELYGFALNRYTYGIVVSFAGSVADRIYTGEMQTGKTSDYDHIRMHINALVEEGFFGPPISLGSSYDRFAGGPEKAVETYWRKMEDFTESFLRKHWREVTAVAEELMLRKTLSGKETVAVIEANQTVESLNYDVIPRTLAAIRAEAIAASQRKNVMSGSDGLLDQPNTPIATDENVVIINGSGNGVIITPTQQVQAQTPSAQTTQGTNDNGPTLINNAQPDFEPPLVKNDPPADPPEQKA
jgi:cell division protease FtsH